MRKQIFTMMALAAALCACNKEQPLIPETGTPEVKPQKELIFTATMEGAPVSKATFDNTDKCASWEMGDQISLNGVLYKANAAGTSTTFTKEVIYEEIRPTFVSSANTQSYNNQPAQNLVDEKGTETRWIATKDMRVRDAWGENDVWNIVVKTDKAIVLM